jgi:hypothetical protein
MARIRSIPPDLATDPKLIACSLPARLLALMSWPWHDDEGCLGYDPVRIRLNAFPNDSAVDASPLIDELLDSGWFELRVSPDGKRFLWCTEFLTYQRVPHPTKSKFRLAESTRILASAPESSADLTSAHENSHRMDGGMERSGAERMGVDGKERSGADGADGRMLARPPESAAAAANGTAPHPPAAADRPAPPADAGAAEERTAPPLPDEALVLLHRMPDAKRDDGEQQLRATRTAQGAKLKAGEYVRAYSLAHLTWACQAVLDSPPDKSEQLARWVLLKLRDTFAEWRSRDDKHREQKTAPAIAAIMHPVTLRDPLECARDWLADKPDVKREIETEAEAKFAGFPKNPAMLRRHSEWIDNETESRWREAGSPVPAAHGAVDAGGGP